MTLPGTPPVATDLVHHIGIAVSSLDESIEFYRGLFGFQPGKIIVPRGHRRARLLRAGGRD